jgi:hypothetical protein
MVEARSLQPGSVVRNRGRLWRVDDVDGEVLVATSIDGGLAEQHDFYLPFEDITSAQLDFPPLNRVGFPQSQDLLLRAYRLSMMHGSAPLVSLQRSRVIPTKYQLVPVVMALNTPRVRRPRNLGPLPLGGPTFSSTVTYWWKLLATRVMPKTELKHGMAS